MLKQRVQHGRDDDGDGHPEPLDRAQKLTGVEAGDHRVGPSGHRQGEQPGASSQMEQWRNMKVDAVLRDAQIHQSRHGVGDEVVVAEHHALGPPGGSARVEQRRQIRSAPLGVLHRGRRRYQGLVVQRGGSCALHVGSAGDEMGEALTGFEQAERFREVSRVGKQNLRTAVVQAVSLLRRCPPAVDGSKHAPGPEHGEVIFHIAR